MKNLFAALSVFVLAISISHRPAIAAPETTNNTIHLLCDSGTVTIDPTAKTFEVDFLVNDALARMAWPVKMTIKDGQVQKDGTAAGVNITSNTITANGFLSLETQLNLAHAFSIDRRSGMLTFLMFVTPVREICIPMPKQMF